MKKNIIAIVIIILILAGCFAFQKFSTRTVMNDDNASGNSSGNLLNGGTFCEDNDKIYFSNPNDDGSLYSMNTDLTHYRKIHSDKPSYINVAGPYLYYSRINNTKENSSSSIFIFNNSGIYRIHKNNSAKMKMLFDGPTGIINLAGNYVYYQQFGDEYGLKLYRAKIDGKKNEKVHDEGFSPASISNGTMYFSNIDKDHNILKMDLSNSQINDVLKANTLNSIISDDVIYYMSQTDNYGIAKCNLDGSEKELIVKERCSTFNTSISGKYLYYQVDGGDNNRICRMNLETRESTTLKQGNFSQIQTTSDYVFFKDFNSNNIFMANTGENDTVERFNPEVKK